MYVDPATETLSFLIQCFEIFKNVHTVWVTEMSCSNTGCQRLFFFLRNDLLKNALLPNTFQLNQQSRVRNALFLS